MDHSPTLYQRLLAHARGHPAGPRIHGWRWKRVPALDELRRCLMDQVTLIEMALGNGRLLSDRTGSDERPELPRAGFLAVAFNGWRDQAAEPFVFPGEFERGGAPCSNFCDTQGRSYDDLVVACLLVATVHFPEGALSVFTQATEEEAMPGLCLFRQLFRTTPCRPFWDQEPDPGEEAPEAT